MVAKVSSFCWKKKNCKMHAGVISRNIQRERAFSLVNIFNMKNKQSSNKLLKKNPGLLI